MISRLYRKLRRVFAADPYRAYPNITGSTVTCLDGINPTAQVHDSILTGNIKLDEFARVQAGVRLAAVNRRTITLGRYAVLNGPNTDVCCGLQDVTIGAFTSIARYVAIQEYNHSYDSCSTYFIRKHLFQDEELADCASRGPITIGSDVWIGAQCVILSGATIGDGAVIGANSVVTGAIPPYAIAAGSPARVIRYRFDEEIVARLLELRWWAWPLERLQRNRPLFEGKLSIEKLLAVSL